tara:strand:- start:339 stop:884 length:546 start_codon:yes stop_codon:yes gene_type:complete
LCFNLVLQVETTNQQLRASLNESIVSQRNYHAAAIAAVAAVGSNTLRSDGTNVKRTVFAGNPAQFAVYFDLSTLRLTSVPPSYLELYQVLNPNLGLSFKHGLSPEESKILVDTIQNSVKEGCPRVFVGTRIRSVGAPVPVQICIYPQTGNTSTSSSNKDPNLVQLCASETAVGYVLVTDNA